MKKHLFIFLTASFLLWTCHSPEKEDNISHFINKYDSIRLISYNTARDVFSGTVTFKIENNSLKISNIKFIDDIILTKNSSRNIFDVLLSKPDSCSTADCYNPRHVLLFYKRDKIIGFYEFCAACGGSYKSNNIKISPICSEQALELSRIFKEMNLKNDGKEDKDFKYY